MKLNTHDRTPRPKTSKVIKILFAICFCLIYGIFLLGSFACFYYSNSIVSGMFMILLPIVLTFFVWITISDMNKAYVEIGEETVYVVDYYMRLKREKEISICDIASAEIIQGYSHKVRGYRWGMAGFSYIVFRGDTRQYLFKIIYTPETKRVFQEYMNVKCK